MDELNWIVDKMSTPDAFLGLQYTKHGSPNEVISLEEISISQCITGEVIVQMEVAAIHPSDIGLINGSYGSLKNLPAVGGREGVGIIHQVGSGVDEKLVGRPVFLPDSLGTWQEFVKMKVDEVVFLPSLISLDQLAISVLNPLTAWRLLNDFEYLRPGDFIIQNAGNSAVGLSVIQFAKRMGLQCISLVRSQKAMDDIRAFSETIVFLDEDSSCDEVLAITEEAGCSIAFNSIGGKSSLRLAKCLRDGGVHVTFGAMDGTPIRFPTRNLIFNDIRFVGFWLDRWKKKKSLDQIRIAIEDVLQPLALNELRHPVDSIFTLEDFKSAFLRNGQSRFGKVLFCRDEKNAQPAKDLAVV